MAYNLRYVPVIISTTLLGVVIITTCLAYYYEHVTSAYIPYISDTGTIPPESCIFGQALNILWVQVSFAMYCKFRQVNDILQKHNMDHKESLNKYSFIIGMLAAFGMSIVGNFQETTSFIVHWIGAILCFGFGSFYLCMQTSLYLAITPVLGQINVTKIRIVLSAVALVTFVIFFVSAMVSYTKFTGQNYLDWQPEHGGYRWHVTSAVAEWICALAISIFIVLFGEEFKNAVIHEPVIDTELTKQNTNPKKDLNKSDDDETDAVDSQK